MTETIDDSAAAEARAEQARLARKARREAKVRAGGTSRLNKISGVGGGLQRSDEDIPAPATSSAAAMPTATPAPKSASVNDDPEEVDISQHFYTPERRRQQPGDTPAGMGMGGMGGMGSMGGMGNMGGMGGMNPMGGMGLDEAQLRALMLGTQPPSASNPSASPGGDEDPMMAMMTQMLGGGPGGASPFPFPGMGGAAMAVPNKPTSLWRLLHTTLALGLGLYIALWTSFRGTKGERSLGLVDEGEETARKRFFYAFATAEAVLLTTRYFVDGGVGGGGGAGGVLGMVVGMLPRGKVRGGVEMGMRYARVLGTVRGDVLVLVFVLGVCSWVRG